jgi:hypothetical protein
MSNMYEQLGIKYPDGQQEALKEYAELSRIIDFAYAHRISTGLVEVQGGFETQDSLEAARELGVTLASYDPEAVIVCPEMKFEVHQVVTANAHLYPMLLRCAFRRASEGYLSYEEVQNYVNETLKHEYRHYAAALDEAIGECHVYFGVSFIEDAETMAVGVQPFIYPVGRFSRAGLDAIARAPEDLSLSDCLRGAP